MSDQDAAPKAKSPSPYKPFPTFKEWSAQQVDLSVFDIYAQDMLEAKASSGEQALAEAVATATRWAAVNTGAIEGLYEADRGFTYSVAVSAAAWSSIHLVKGPEASDNMQDALRAYEFVLDATTSKKPITEFWIKALHSTSCESQATYTVFTDMGVPGGNLVKTERDLIKGKYKTEPNSPYNVKAQTVHGYASPLETVAEMGRLVAELTSELFVTAHPVMQAAYAHYAFVCVHPFADGNGRVSRALASTFLYRNPGVPLVIFADQKGEYLDALESADAGSFSKFTNFIADRAIDTVGMVRSQLASFDAPSISDQMSAMARVLVGKEGLAHTEIDAIAARLLKEFRESLMRQIEENPLSPPMSAAVAGGSGQVTPSPAGFRQLPGRSPSYVSLAVDSAAPASGSERRSYAVVISKPGTDGADFRLVSPTRELLKVFLREVHPTISSAFTFRADQAASLEYREMVFAVSEQATKSLRKQGYVE